jgi:hypothetical protein
MAELVKRAGQYQKLQRTGKLVNMMVAHQDLIGLNLHQFESDFDNI